MPKGSDSPAIVSIYLDGAPASIVKARKELLEILPDEPNSKEFCEHFNYDKSDIGRHVPARYPTASIELDEDCEDLPQPIFILQHDIGRENLWHWYLFASEHNLRVFWELQKEGDQVTTPVYKTNDLRAKFFKNNLWATFNRSNVHVRNILREEYKDKYEETFTGTHVNDFFDVLSAAGYTSYKKALEENRIPSYDFRITRIKRVDTSKTENWFKERAAIFNSLRNSVGLDFQDAAVFRKHAYAGPAYKINGLKKKMAQLGVKETAQMLLVSNV